MVKLIREEGKVWGGQGDAVYGAVSVGGKVHVGSMAINRGEALPKRFSARPDCGASRKTGMGVDARVNCERCQDHAKKLGL